MKKPSKRAIEVFASRTRPQQLISLIDALRLCMTPEPPTVKRKTDLIGMACQFGRLHGIQRADFESILDLTIGELIEMFDWL